MPKEQIEKILAQLADHETRLKQLENGAHTVSVLPVTGGDKQKTIREIVKGKVFKNGQEQLAVIVGYHEVMLKKPVTKTSLKDEWLAAKMLNKYDAKFLERAKDVLFRIHADDTCILTQTGEDFFEKFIKNESSDTASK